MTFNTPLILAVVANLAVSVLGQIQSFLSEPTLAPPTVVVQTNNAALTLPDYIFVAPFQSNQPGPVIYDSNGTLIWDGAAFIPPGQLAQDLTVCQYHGSPHLCFVTGTEFNGFARGNGTILDNTYTVVKTVAAGNGGPGIDQHEFYVKDNATSVLATEYEQVPFNTAPFGIPRVSFVSQGTFQEIDIDTGKVIFEWKSLDHVPVNQSFVLPGTTDISGDGKTIGTAWDYFHINSVDKDSLGNYLVSGRHVKTIFYVSGVDGHVIWQLGGKASTFSMNYQFNFQHHARLRNASGTTVTLSLYDNGADDSPPPPGQTKPGYEPYSSGIVAVVDTAAMTSTILERYVSPGHQLSTSQGNLQYLDNGNKFMGMGQADQMVEFTDNSTGASQVAFYAHMAFQGNSGHPSYRNFKFPWSAPKPAAPPALFTYAQNCTSQLVFYASWNGATDVASWRFLSGSSASNSSFNVVGNVPKAGFETQAVFPKFAPFGKVEAVDAQGNILAVSPVIQTFVPATSLAPKCGPTACAPGTNYATAANQTCPSSSRGYHHWQRINAKGFTAVRVY